jgi:hypothetical protein
LVNLLPLKAYVRTDLLVDPLQPVNLAAHQGQGDQIGLIFAQWAIVYLGQLF